MVPYRMATHQPRWAPVQRRHAHFVGSPARLGQDLGGLGLLTGGLVGILASGAAAYVGIYTGTHASGLGSVVGWVVGIVSILSGLGVILTLAGVGLLAAAA